MNSIRVLLVTLFIASTVLAPRLANSITGVSVKAAGQSTTSRLDPSTFDSSVRPQDDLFTYVNGQWMAHTDIPGDRVSYGTFEALTDDAELAVRAAIESLIASGARRQGSSAQQIVDLYSSMLDEARVEALGDTPIVPELRRIDAIASTRDLASEAGYLTSIAAGGPFGGAVAVDAADSSRIIVQVSQGGTLLPDREYYLSADQKYVEIRARYEAYLTRIFTLTDRPAGAEAAHQVMALETALARIEWPLTGNDPAKTGHGFALDALGKTMPGFDWVAWAKPQGIDRAQGLVLTQPSFFKAFAALVPDTPLATWKAWLAARYITAMAPYLSRPFSDARFDFFGRVLAGQESVRVAWKRGVGLASSFVGDAVGKLYISQNFSSAARSRAETMVHHIIDACSRAIRQLDWMSASTKRGAIGKLARLTIKVGYPDRWRDYTGLVVKPDDLVGNLTRARKFDNDYRMTKVRADGDHSDWLITPQTVNAYYNPALNEITLPAAILQPPLFDPAADDAVNYGAIGAIIGHELGHAFDGLGRQFDASGAPHDWWTAADDAEFRVRALRLVAQFNAYTPLPGMHINGLVTLGENIGDLGGLSVAFDAYKTSLGGKPSPVIDGLTGEQRFFLAWARVWRSKMHDEFLRQLLVAVPYAPPAYRANGAVSNIAGFYEAFGVKPGDRLYRDPADRVIIW